MNFFEKNGYYCAVRITGPTHNFLGLRFSQASIEVMEIEKKRLDNHNFKLLDESLVLEFVRSAILFKAKERNVPLFLSGIQFVLDDSSPESIYYDLTCQIIEHNFKLR